MFSMCTEMTRLWPNYKFIFLDRKYSSMVTDSIYDTELGHQARIGKMILEKDQKW